MRRSRAEPEHSLLVVRVPAVHDIQQRVAPGRRWNIVDSRRHMRLRDLIPTRGWAQGPDPDPSPSSTNAGDA